MNSVPHIIWLTVVLLLSCGEPAVEPSPPQTNATTGGETTGTPSGPRCEDGPGEVYTRRIEPLLQQDRPSSCAKCHAAGVHLAEFVTGDACSSMACLVGQGMVDLEQPRESPLLKFIERGYEPAANTGVTDVMVAREYTGFLEWIEWSAACPDQCPPGDGSLSCPMPETPLRPEEPAPEIPPLNLENYPCTEDDQARAFRDWVFPTQGRCGHCHAVNGALAGIADSPAWIAAQRTVFGSKQTISNLYALDAINLRHPAKSKLLLKPLHTDAGGVAHGGGGKFIDETDELYVNMLQWIQMQATCDLTRGAPTPEWPEDKLRTRYPELPYAP